MSKSTIICESCGIDNAVGSEFCIDCGAKLKTSPKTLPARAEGVYDANHKMSDKRRKFYKSLPPLIGVSLFLIFIDLITGGGLDWWYWPVVPIVIFAILVPWISIKIDESELI